MFSDIPVEFFYVLVLALCAWGFLKASKVVLKLVIIVAAVAFIIIKVIPGFGG